MEIWVELLLDLEATMVRDGAKDAAIVGAEILNMELVTGPITWGKEGHSRGRYSLRMPSGVAEITVRETSRPVERRCWPATWRPTP